jgi:glycosyltransferase involved in cell wall biosynthesis
MSGCRSTYDRPERRCRWAPTGSREHVTNESGEERRLQPGISAVVPVFRSAAILPSLHERLVVALARLTTDFELILVEDGGGDGSWSVIQALAVADDLQNPPEEIGKLLERLDEQTDVVYGTPAQEEHGFLRDQASRITKMALQGPMGAETARHVSAFRVFRTRLRDAFTTYRGPTVAIDVLLTWATTRFAHVTVQHEPRRVGKSTYTLRKLITHAFTMMTGFSTLPLQIASLIGFIFTVFGVVILLYVFANFLLNGSAVPGFAFLASIVAIFSGAQLFALGIIGEYLARMHFRTMEQPTYLIKEAVGMESAIDEVVAPGTSREGATIGS